MHVLHKNRIKGHILLGHQFSLNFRLNYRIQLYSVLSYERTLILESTYLVFYTNSRLVANSKGYY